MGNVFCSDRGALTMEPTLNLVPFRSAAMAPLEGVGIGFSCVKATLLRSLLMVSTTALESSSILVRTPISASSTLTIMPQANSPTWSSLLTVSSVRRNKWRGMTNSSMIASFTIAAEAPRPYFVGPSVCKLTRTMVPVSYVCSPPPSSTCTRSPTSKYLLSIDSWKPRVCFSSPGRNSSTRTLASPFTARVTRPRRFFISPSLTITMSCTASCKESLSSATEAGGGGRAAGVGGGGIASLSAS
mmetsp:Transcript_50900/g.120904  ORF Transcript_50900/g.120904 Transcript_50900/m.120904 type:complete len:243 (-) Transcript_50900:663-1391(-)